MTLSSYIIASCFYANILLICLLNLKAEIYLEIDFCHEAHQCVREASAIFPLSHVASYMVSLSNPLFYVFFTTGATHEIVLTTCYETTVHIFCEQHTRL